jgi:hypothetical protein
VPDCKRLRRTVLWPRRSSRRALDPLITYLTLSEVLAPSVAASVAPAPEMVERYRRYVLVERGFT